MDNKTIDSIYEAQRNFFNSGKTFDHKFRREQLKKLLNAIISNKEEIYAALKTDLNKSFNESFISEVGFIITELKHTIKEFNEWVKPVKVKDTFFSFPSKSNIVYEPYGLSLIIAPWNYPFQLIFSPLIGAMAAGNCAILKPSPESENVSAAINKIISSNFSPEYIAVIEGGHDINQYILQKRFDYIFFTGSVSFGKYVASQAAQHLTPVTLELGGKSPCIINNDAKIDMAAKKIVWGKFLNAGQTCIAPDYLLVHKEIKGPLITRLIYWIKQFYGENIIECSFYPRIINDAAFNRIETLIKSSTGKIIFGGLTDAEQRYISPTIIDSPSDKDNIMEEEIFGPLLPVITVESVEAAVSFINAREKPLALYYFGDEKDGGYVVSHTSSGGVCINDTLMQLVNTNLPFGGVGNSGYGSYHSKATFDTFSHKKSVLIKNPHIDFKFRYAPFNLPAFIKKLMD